MQFVFCLFGVLGVVVSWVSAASAVAWLRSGKSGCLPTVLVLVGAGS